MARRSRLTVPALPHHVVQRGTNRQPIFFADADHRFFLADPVPRKRSPIIVQRGVRSAESTAAHM